MSLSTSPELFLNIKRVPGTDSKEYKPFWKEEKRKVKQGVTINGIYIPGWLYWHTNHWTLDVDLPPDPQTGYIERFTKVPDFRDNEWMIGNAIHEAEQDHKGLLIIGSRQLGKSEFGASYMGRRAIAFKNTQNIVAGLSTYDLGILTSKIDRGFINLHPYFSPQLRILNNWNKHVVLGYKDKKGNQVKFSEILIRNLEEGKSSENLAGPTTSSLLLDEVGKGKFLEAFIAAKPALQTPFGWRCSPIFTGTSGSFDKSEDLQNFYSKLGAFNFLCVQVKDKIRGVTRRYIPGYQASKVPRKKVRLSDYLHVPRGSELDITPIHIIRSQEEGEKTIQEEIDRFTKVGELTLAKKERMYHPILEEDLFLTDEADDIFADIKEMAKQQLAYLESIDVDEKYVWMTRDPKSGEVKTVKASTPPIIQFPIPEEDKQKIDFDAPIIIWADPIPGQEYGILHVSGADPYNQDEAPTSQSLGSFFVYRRTYDPINGLYQEQFVAEYTARPPKIGKWREQVEMLMEYYQATCLPENEDAEFIRFFDKKHKIHWLEDGLDLAKEINPKTQVKRNKGLSASTANIRYGNGRLKGYCQEEIIVGQDANGDNIIKYGIVRIKSKGLLKEIIAHKAGLNVDRIVAARHTLINAGLKDKFFPVAKVTKPIKPEDRQKKNNLKKSPFLLTPNGSFAKNTGRSSWLRKGKL
jgi:SHS2 domain-containing protein